MFLAQLFSKNRWIVLIIMLLSSILACTTQPELQKLRITNNGNTNIENLVVIFPERYASDMGISRVLFGNIPAGQTTEYQDVPSGVYRYAAYEYTLDGQVVSQFVTDWVGEDPMAGKKLTYQIVLDLTKVKGDQVTLVTVLVDEP